jgi:hypothetical protein
MEEAIKVEHGEKSTGLYNGIDLEYSSHIAYTFFCPVYIFEL